MRRSTARSALILIVGIGIGQFVEFTESAHAGRDPRTSLGVAPHRVNLENILQAGGGISIDASRFRESELQSIASKAVSKSRLHITNAGLLSENDCVSLTEICKGEIMFSFWR